MSLDQAYVHRPERSQAVSRPAHALYGSPPPKSDSIIFQNGDFNIRRADTRVQVRTSDVLIERMYAWRGYKHELRDEQPHNPNEVTLQACKGDEVFGTLTLRFDSDKGLSADTLYRQEIDVYRNAGANVFELTRLAIDPEHGSKEVLGALFHFAHIYGTLLRGCTDVFIEVNPRHVSFYKRMLHFREGGEAKVCPRVDAPAMLMHLDTAHVSDQVARCGGHGGQSRTSLYPYFFSPTEEERLSRRIGGEQAVFLGFRTPVHNGPSRTFAVRSSVHSAEALA